MERRTLVLKRLILIALIVAVTALIRGQTFPMRSWTRTITFAEPLRIGNMAVPAGTYSVRHVMEGAHHIMIFTRSGKSADQFRAACHLVPLDTKAPHDQQHYTLGPAGERTLLSLLFEGEAVKHVF